MDTWWKGILAIFVCATSVTAAADAAPTVKMNAVEVVGTDLRVELSGGRTLAGSGLVGSLLGLRTEDGAAVRVKVEAVMADPRDKTGQVFLYRFTARDAAGQWQPICSPGPDGLQLGIPQPGADGKLVIWCTAGALGKCVRFGYHPWGKLPDGTPLARYHRA